MVGRSAIGDDRQGPDVWAARVRRRRGLSFWSSDWSLTILLWLLAGNIFALPLAHFLPWGRLAVRAVLSLIIISGVIATARNRRFVAVTTTFTLVFLFVGWEGVQRPTLYLDVLNDVGALLFFGFFVALILRQVLRAGSITWHRVEGAVAVYLLMGLLWAFAYSGAAATGILQLEHSKQWRRPSGARLFQLHNPYNPWSRRYTPGECSHPLPSGARRTRWTALSGDLDRPSGRDGTRVSADPQAVTLLKHSAGCNQSTRPGPKRRETVP